MTWVEKSQNLLKKFGEKTLEFLKWFGEKLLFLLRYKHHYITGFLFALILGILLEWEGWWYLMLLAGGFAGFLMKKHALISFLIGFAGIAIAWFCFFIYFMIIGPLFAFTDLIASILGIFEGCSFLFILITVMLGGLLGGLGAINGTYLAALIYHPEPSSPEPPNIKKKFEKDIDRY